MNQGTWFFQTKFKSRCNDKDTLAQKKREGRREKERQRKCVREIEKGEGKKGDVWLIRRRQRRVTGTVFDESYFAWFPLTCKYHLTSLSQKYFFLLLFLSHSHTHKHTHSLYLSLSHSHSFLFCFFLSIYLFAVVHWIHFNFKDIISFFPWSVENSSNISLNLSIWQNVSLKLLKFEWYFNKPLFGL